MELIRFFIVSLVGVLIDIGIAWFLSVTLALPLWFCAAIGFTLAAVSNYALHESWTFRQQNAKLSGRRGVQYFGAALTTLLMRLAVVAALERTLGPDWSLAILIVGAGVSFFVNFALSKFLVFAGTASGKSES
ncbi:GtrA family protein [Pseudooceanicola onchidii]|uniref:GtrA family protein n=1 Tax=Pseudooceanicola onchidii TaxID=2562279 RepID=UPI0010AAD52A|nr:GtrA family protein [Pseudooceanicola onchidii]